MSAGVVALLLTAVLLPLVLDELRDWSPSLASAVARWAARRLGDPQARTRYEEEWAANIEAVPGKLSALITALGYLLVIPQMRWTLKRAPRSVPNQPRQMPQAPPVLIGIDRNVAELDRRLLSSGGTQTGNAIPKIVAISGIPGLGKTALAVHWAHLRANHFPDGQLYVNMQGSHRQRMVPLDLADALAIFLKACGVQSTRIPRSLQGRVAMFRSRITGRRILIVLDDVVAIDQIRHLLPDSSLSAVVLTSRKNLIEDIDCGYGLDLDTLVFDDAKALLGKLAGAARLNAEPEASSELVELCGGLPLTIRIAAERLTACPNQTIASLADELRRATNRPYPVDGARSAVIAVFDVTYEELPPDAQRLFRLLGAVNASGTLTPGGLWKIDPLRGVV
jgi:hypothetical protein